MLLADALSFKFCCLFKTMYHRGTIWREFYSFNEEEPLTTPHNFVYVMLFQIRE